VRHGVQGVQGHDARLVAWMQSHGLTHVLTLNAADFARYPGITTWWDPNSSAGWPAFPAPQPMHRGQSKRLAARCLAVHRPDGADEAATADDTSKKPGLPKRFSQFIPR
jgi:hypothetical protein